MKKQAHEFLSGKVFDTQKAHGKTQQLPLPLSAGACVFDMQEWYQVAIGRYLAPAKATHGAPVEYLLQGEDRGGRHLKKTIDEEVKALHEDLKQLGVWLKRQAESQGDAAERLWVLVSVLELRLPDPETDPEAFRLCQGALQITQWGIERGTERKLGDLLEAQSDMLGPYCKSVKAALDGRYLAGAEVVESSRLSAVPPTSAYRRSDLLEDPEGHAQKEGGRRSLLPLGIALLLGALLGTVICVAINKLKILG